MTDQEVLELLRKIDNMYKPTGEKHYGFIMNTLMYYN